ncbi:hypothetical protein F5887DRAFT_1059217 [Amanita rubescens]|nr:hypothetical protein F5887DRAFT_1059217 [Amanita rubescens]
MPKNTKKRKEKSADFTKPKLKLGKKQVPGNVIDTSFKARTIALPTQSIAVEKKDDTPVTKRGLSVDDLLVHLKHYNPSTRKDAIFGLRELFESHWDLSQSHLVPLLNGLVRLLSDEDASVRKTLTSFLAWLLPRIPSEELIPHSSLLLLYVTSAQTHIFPELRIDAIRVLNILLDCIPGVVTAGCCQANGGHGSRVLDGYLGILSAGSKYDESEGPVQATSTASVILSPASKLVVLQSLASFLRSGLSPSPTSGSGPPWDSPGAGQYWFLSQAFKTLESYSSFNSLLEPLNHDHNADFRRWSAEDQFDENFTHYPSAMSFVASGSWALEELAEERRSLDPSPTYKAADTLNYDYLVHLARNLQSTLVSTFLDCAPAVFSPSEKPLETSLQLILAVSQISRTLYSSLLQHRSFLNEQIFLEMNVIFCELAALHKFAIDYDLDPLQRPAKRKPKPTASHAKDAPSKWLASVSDYIVLLLRGEAVCSTQIGRPMSPSAYISLAPAIWFLLDSDSQGLGCAGQQQGLLHAVIDHSLKAPSKSATKGPSIDFIARLVLLDTGPQYQGSFNIGRSMEIDEKFKEWLLHLPQCLWELGAVNLPMTEVIMRALLRLLQRKPRLVHAKALGSKLVPYFSISHAVRGRLPGPYAKLPSSDLRRLTLDVVATLFILPSLGNQEERLLVGPQIDVSEHIFW